jgi:hypothetical protein
MARVAATVAEDIEEPDTAEPTLRETIESARDEIAAREEADGSQRESIASSDGTANSSAIRDEHGRFTRRDGSGEAQAGEAASQQSATPQSRQQAQSPQATGAQEAAPAATQSASLAPQGWTPAAKAKWAQLPDDIRAEISRRETDMHRQLTQHDEHRSAGKQFAEISQQHAAIIQRTGVHPLRIYQDFLGIMNVLSTGDPQSKAALLRDVAMRNGLDMRALTGLPQPGQPNAQPSPQNAPGQPQAVIPQELRQVATEWNQFKQQQQRESQEREQREQQQTLNEIVDFRSKPEARFFDAVKDQMVALLQVGAVSTLEEAYAQAIWTRPDIRSILQAEETQKQQAEQAKRVRTQSARAKGGSVRGGMGSVAEAAPANRSLREELQANFAEARSRV